MDKQLVVLSMHDMHIVQIVYIALHLWYVTQSRQCESTLGKVAESVNLFTHIHTYINE